MSIYYISVSPLYFQKIVCENNSCAALRKSIYRAQTKSVRKTLAQQFMSHFNAPQRTNYNLIVVIIFVYFANYIIFIAKGAHCTVIELNSLFNVIIMIIPMYFVLVATIFPRFVIVWVC